MNFAELKDEHEKLIENFCNARTEAFQVRIRELLAVIREELPELNGIVSCNGETWPVGEKWDEYPLIKYIRSDPQKGENRYPRDTIKALFDGHNLGGWMPKVNGKTMTALTELVAIINYMHDARFHTLCEPEVLFKEMTR